MAFNATYRPKGKDDPEFADLAKKDEYTDSESHQRSQSRGAHDDEDESEGLPPPTSINAVRSNASQNRMAAYLADFDAEAADESRAICSLPATIVDNSARAQLLAAGIETENEEMQHVNSLLHIDHLRKNRLLELEEKRRHRRQAQESQLQAIKLMRQQTNELVTTYYTQARRELEIHLTSRQGEVSQSIGEIRKFRYGDYDPDKPDWPTFEQQVQIRVVRIRGIKDKVPKGKYIMLVSKWDKLGGEPLAWSTRKVTDKPPPPCGLHNEIKNMEVKHACEVCNGWAGSTHEITYGAKPKDYDMRFDSKMSTFFLPQTRVRPYNALVFELVRLPEPPKMGRVEDAASLRPQVVGWGSLPIVDSRFEVINGKFRFPLLRGPYKPRFGKYEHIHAEINADLENWLGNLFIDIFPFAREHFGRSEFDLQREFSMKVLQLGRYPAARDPEGWPVEKNRRRGASIDATADAEAQNQIDKGMFNAEALLALGTETAYKEDEFPYQRPHDVPEMDTPALTRWNLLRLAIVDRQRQKRREELDEQRKAIKQLELQKRFRYAIHPFGATQLESIWRIQVEYCIRAILDDLSLRHPLSIKFWFNIFVFLTVLYMQLFLHSIFVYFALWATWTPVHSVKAKWYGLDVVYSHQQTYQVEELAIAGFSMLAMYFLQLFQSLFAIVIKLAADGVPELLSKFIFLTSLTVLLVPWIELIIDFGAGLRRSDCLRLWDYFHLHGYGWYYAIIAFGLLYFLISACAVVSTFLYTMRLHLNGILQDAYYRIMRMNEDNTHIPDDLELSLVELQYILSRAERWRGANGERRKTSVQRLCTTDKEFQAFERNDLHIIIHQLQCGVPEEYFKYGVSHIYRQFFVLEEGTILEALDDGTMPVGVGFVLNALQKQAEAQRKNQEAAALRDQDPEFMSGAFGNEDSMFFSTKEPSAQSHRKRTVVV